MNLEEIKSLKLHFVNKIQTTPSFMNNIQDSHCELAEKITKISICMKRIRAVKENTLLENDVTIAADTDTVLLINDLSNKSNRPQKTYRTD